MSASERLPGPLAADLLDGASSAFTQGLHAGAITSAAIVLGTAILTLVLLRHAGLDAETSEEDGTAVAAEVPGEP